jgi:protein-L-isoaspartate(D-aspartate) O-methyltransferase
MSLKIQYTSAINSNWTKEYLVSLLTTGKNPVVKDPNIANAFLKVDRVDFLPEMLKYLAYNDVNIDIGNGSTLVKPTSLAIALSYLKPKFGGKYLVLGSETGYIPAVIGFVVGEQGKVIALESHITHTQLSKYNLNKYPKIRNVLLLSGGYSTGFPQQAPYDGIFITEPIANLPEVVKLQVKQNGGTIVSFSNDSSLKVLERQSVDNFIEEIIPGVN